MIKKEKGRKRKENLQDKKELAIDWLLTNDNEYFTCHTLLMGGNISFKTWMLPQRRQICPNSLTNTFPLSCHLQISSKILGSTTIQDDGFTWTKFSSVQDVFTLHCYSFTFYACLLSLFFCSNSVSLKCFSTWSNLIVRFDKAMINFW